VCGRKGLFLPLNGLGAFSGCVRAFVCVEEEVGKGVGGLAVDGLVNDEFCDGIRTNWGVLDGMSWVWCAGVLCFAVCVLRKRLRRVDGRMLGRGYARHSYLQAHV
jgi:hypothetical protein